MPSETRVGISDPTPMASHQTGAERNTARLRPFGMRLESMSTEIAAVMPEKHKVAANAAMESASDQPIARTVKKTITGKRTANRVAASKWA